MDMIKHVLFRAAVAAVIAWLMFGVLLLISTVIASIGAMEWVNPLTHKPARTALAVMTTFVAFLAFFSVE